MSDIDSSTEREPDSPGKFTLYKRRWLVLAVYSLVSMTNQVIWVSLSSISTIVERYYNISSTAVDWLSMLYLALLIAFVVLSSYMLDRYGLRFAIIIGAVLNGLGSCLRCIGSNRDGFVFVFFGSSLAGIGQVFLLIIPPRLAAVWFGEHERATASAIGVLLTMSGVAVAFIMCIIVPDSKDLDTKVHSGMVTLLVAQCVIASALVVVCVIFVQDAPPTPPSQLQALVSQLKDKDRMRDILTADKECPPLVECRDPASIGDKSSSTDEETSEKIPLFRESLLILAKDKNFHILVHAYSIYYGLMCAYNTILNQMVTLKYPGKEKEIGYLGAVANVIGISGMLLSGIWIDKTRRYKSVSIFIISFAGLTILIFTLLLKYDDHFWYMFVSFCFFGLFAYPYMSAGLEHAAETTYPVPEGTTSGILLLFGSVYGIGLIYLLGAILDRGAYATAGYVMAGLYAFATLLISFHNTSLKRSEL